jgi:hypothetical protein
MRIGASCTGSIEAKPDVLDIQSQLSLRMRVMIGGVRDAVALVLTLPRLKPGDSRFCAAAYATAPRRRCPSLSMFLAALWSRCKLVPHSGQMCQRTDKPLAMMMPQPEHVWLV